MRVFKLKKLDNNLVRKIIIPDKPFIKCQFNHVRKHLLLHEFVALGNDLAKGLLNYQRVISDKRQEEHSSEF